MRYTLTFLIGLMLVAPQAASAYIAPQEVLTNYGHNAAGYLPRNGDDADDAVRRRQEESIAKAEQGLADAIAAQNPEPEVLHASADEEPATEYIDIELDPELIYALRAFERFQEQQQERELEKLALEVLASRGVELEVTPTIESSLHASAGKGPVIPVYNAKGKGKGPLYPTGPGTWAAVLGLLLAGAATALYIRKNVQVRIVAE